MPTVLTREQILQAISAAETKLLMIFTTIAMVNTDFVPTAAHALAREYIQDFSERMNEMIDIALRDMQKNPEFIERMKNQHAAAHAEIVKNAH
jgi:hypothetical protein